VSSRAYYIRRSFMEKAQGSGRPAKDGEASIISPPYALIVLTTSSPSPEAKFSLDP